MNDAEINPVKLSELLRNPDDLDKLAALKSEFTRKKTAVDGMLRVGLQEQLTATQAGTGNIADGQRAVELIKAEMQRIDRLCAEAAGVIRDLPHINLVSQTHRNFSLVETMKTDITEFDERLRFLEQLLREDDGDMENQPNLLAIHLELSKLRDIKDSALDQVKNSGEAGEELINNLRLGTGATVQEYFGRLNDVVEWFDDHVGTACMQLIPLIQSGNNGLVVRLALVIQEEEKNDKRARALQDARQEYKELASRFKSITAGSKEVRGYKEKFLKTIELAANGQMQDTNDAFQEDADKIEKNLRWFFNDLNTVKLGMVSLMPKKWKIFETYVTIYHKQMHDWLVSRIDDPELRPPQILAIVNWIDPYYSKMKKLGVPEDMMRPHVIDERGNELIREYRQLIIKAVDSWMERMSKTDTQTFISRDETALDNDENGSFRTKTLADMWRMLREQLDVASQSKRTDIVEGVVDAMFRALSSRQRMWEQLVDSELQKYKDAKELPDSYQGLQDWLIAIANDQIACIDDDSEGGFSYLSRFSQDIQQFLSDEYTAKAASQLETLRDGYVDLGTHCLAIFAALIFVVDFRALMTDFFTPSWYGKKGMGQAISTFDDYLNDYTPVLHLSLRDILAEELADNLLVSYLSAIKNKGAKLKRTDPFVDKIKDDVLTVFNFFEKFDTFETIKLKWRVVEGFVNLLEADKAAVPEVYRQFKSEYWDVNMAWIEATLRARDDFDRGMLNQVKAKAAAVEVVRGPETIMGKIK